MTNISRILKGAALSAVGGMGVIVPVALTHVSKKEWDGVPDWSFLNNSELPVYGENDLYPDIKRPIQDTSKKKIPNDAVSPAKKPERKPPSKPKDAKELSKTSSAADKKQNEILDSFLEQLCGSYDMHETFTNAIEYSEKIKANNKSVLDSSYFFDYISKLDEIVQYCPQFLNSRGEIS